MKNSNRETIEAARAAIRENPDKAGQAASNEALAGWFVGEVMKRLDGRGDRDTVECVVSCEIAAAASLSVKASETEQMQAEINRLRLEIEANREPESCVANYFDIGRELELPDGVSPFDGVMELKQRMQAALKEGKQLRAALMAAKTHIEWSSKIALAYLGHDNPVNMAEGKSQQWLSLHDHSTTFSKSLLDQIETALSLDSTRNEKSPGDETENPDTPLLARIQELEDALEIFKGANLEWKALFEKATQDSMTARLDALRADGWSVAVHNDYRLSGAAHTFWLFTKGDYAVKGEGKTDTEALDQCRARIVDLQIGGL